MPEYVYCVVLCCTSYLFILVAINNVEINYIDSNWVSLIILYSSLVHWFVLLFYRNCSLLALYSRNSKQIDIILICYSSVAGAAADGSGNIDDTLMVHGSMIIRNTSDPFWKLYNHFSRDSQLYGWKSSFIPKIHQFICDFFFLINWVLLPKIMANIQCV